MSYCAKCGKELDKARACGAPVSADAGVNPKVISAEVKTKQACFGPPGSGEGLWGAISFGVFIIGLAILWIYDYFWPGILFLIALMIIIGALVSYSRR